MERIANFLRKQSHVSLFLEALALAAAIGFIDYVTGYESHDLPVLLHTDPVDGMVWNKKLATVISVLSTLAWWWADAASGHIYSHEWLRILGRDRQANIFLPS